jgi:dihydroorotate dehydrogenase
LELIELVRERWGDRVTVIAGGGVTDFSGVMEYLLAGANHVSIGSVCFNPFKLRKLLKSLTI